MCFGLILGHFIRVSLKDSCPILPSCTEWKNHKIGEVEKLEFAFLDRQALIKDLMSTELKPPKKPKNHLNPIYCDTLTLEKPKGGLEKIEEDEYDSPSLAS